MTTKSFYLHPRKVESRLRSTLYSKAKSVGKCYSILEFDLNEENKTFKFRKVYKIRGVRMEDSKITNGTYSIEIINEEERKLSINIF